MGCRKFLDAGPILVTLADEIAAGRTELFDAVPERLQGIRLAVPDFHQAALASSEQGIEFRVSTHGMGAVLAPVVAEQVVGDPPQPGAEGSRGIEFLHPPPCREKRFLREILRFRAVMHPHGQKNQNPVLVQIHQRSERGPPAVLCRTDKSGFLR